MIQFQYLALLRGINVGGKNIIKMTDLKTCFEEIGLNEVLTYIQSGNVLFKSKENDIVKLTYKIEKALSQKYNYESKLVVISRNHLEEIVKTAPNGFGEELENYKYDFVFLKDPLTPEVAINQIKIKEGVDKVNTGNMVLYFSRLISLASQSRLSRIIQLPMYQNMTIRNWNTTTKLLSMMKES